MMPNLRAVVARSIGFRNFSSSARRRSNESKMGGRFFMTGQTHGHHKLLDTRTRSSVLDILVVWTLVGYGCYCALDCFRARRPSRQRREEIKLIRQRDEEVHSRWMKLLKGHRPPVEIHGQEN